MSKKIHRFITPYTIIENQIKITDKELIHQWKNVLKFKLGENIILANKENGEATCALLDINDAQAICEVNNIKTIAGNHKKEVALYTAILKNENFEFVIQKASEIGVTKIIPIITERTIKTGIKHERLMKIAKEASELSGRIDVTEIYEPLSFMDAIHNSTQYKKQIIFDKNGNEWHAQEDLSIAIFVGPEGGFSENEILKAKESGFEVISLGENMLRGETASIIASYLAVN